MRRIVAGFAIALLAVSCAKKGEEEVETTGVVPVSVETVRKGTIRALVSAAAVVRPATGAALDVIPPAEARIVELPASVGDRVAKGGVLVRFEVPTLASDLSARESDVKSARAALEAAQAAFDRESHLVERGIAAGKDLEAARRDRTSAESALAASESALAAAKELAARSVVRAPFDGVVTVRTHNPGDLVEPGGDPILELVDPARLQVEASVPVTDLPHVTAGASARVIGPATFPPETATVLAVPGAVDSTTAIATVRLGLPKATRLPSGTPVHVEIVAGEHANVLIVSAAAIVRDGDDAFVFVAGDDHAAHRRKVEVGIVAEPDAEIVSGLEGNEQVVSRGAAGLPDGAKIAVRG
ncbi:MAG TPA: efflux RND transporter periplasmic adaptor subunit [Candidatus Polarisedimenticolaceae bacterium]|nr:efflux RND transporter periplasmic adaptor subunit [Candidatus Polarisedimenticolaceae bacterium]